MTLLLRLGPVLAGLGIYALFEWQWQEPLLFPWPLVAGVAIYAIIAWRIAWNRRHKHGLDALWKAVPGCLFVAAAGVSAIMLEIPAWRHGLSLLVAFISYISLELFFLHKYDAPHYPVNGLTHLHVGLVPITNALLAWGFSGVQTFSIKFAPPWLPILVFMVVNALGFAATSHPDATRVQKHLWIVFGAWVGAGIACLVLFLPLSMPAIACLAALLVAVPIRLRRYGFLPRPSSAIAWGELVMASAAFLAILLLSRWA